MRTPGHRGQLTVRWTWRMQWDPRALYVGVAWHTTVELPRYRKTLTIFVVPLPMCAVRVDRVEEYASPRRG